MKLEIWLRKNGEEPKLHNVYQGKNWKGIRCYFETPKGAFIDYKKNVYFENQYRKKGIELEKWTPYYGQEIMCHFIKEE